MTLPHRTSSFFWLWLGYAAVLGLLAWRHEMWRDEHQAWMLATHSATLADLWENTRYEGHPLLWFLVLWPAARLTTNPLAMQGFHLLLAVATAYLVVFRSPFRFAEKVALLFGYYLLFEYGTIVRNYQLGVLLAFLAAWEWGRLSPRYGRLGLWLFLLTQTNAYAALLAVAIAAGVWLEGGFALRRLFGGRELAYLLPTALGMLVFTLTTRPPADANFAPGWFTQFDGERVKMALSAAAQGLFPVPGHWYHFWNSTILSPLAGSVLLLVSLGLGWRLLRANAGSAGLFLSAAGLMLLFMYVKMLPSLRHAGNFFLAFVVAYWHLRERTTPPRDRWFAGAVLGVQVAVGVFAAVLDLLFPFSNSKATAAYLRSLPSAPVAGSPDHLMTPVAGYLREDVYFLGIQRPGSFVKWKLSDYNLPLITLPDTALVRRALVRSRPYGAPVRLVVARRFLTTLPTRPGEAALVPTATGPVRVVCLRPFDEAIQNEEDYVVFNVEPGNRGWLPARTGASDTQR